MPGKQVTELEALPSFTDTSLLPVHNGAGLKKGLLSQLANYLGNKFSNPNLLINPDFKINQRGASSYTSGYTVDRWKSDNATLNASTMVLSNPTDSGATFVQRLENEHTGIFTVTINVASVTGAVNFAWYDESAYHTGKAISKGVNTYTFSASNLTWVGIEITSGASVQLSYMKLEQGSVSTSFIAPNYADELIKCQRYYFKRYYYYAFYSGSASFTYIFSDTIPSMRIKPTVDFANTSNSGLTKAVVSLNTTVKDLTLLIQAVTSKVGNCNVGGTIALDAEIY